MQAIPIEEYFKYHPPTTDARRAAHEAINVAALHFAKTIDAYVVDPDCLKMAMFAVQQARMFANQGITVDELQANYSRLNQIMGKPGDLAPVLEYDDSPITGWLIRRSESGYRAELWETFQQRVEAHPKKIGVYFASVRDASDLIERRRAEHANTFGSEP